ncbi:MAG: inositol monophosphatase [Candidatus Omnitrophica bacterium]|nr:inositol monophosphatase [Candidatus Omnitrophota bacterium]
MAPVDLDGLLLLATDTAKLAAEIALKDHPALRHAKVDLNRDIKLEADYELERVIIENIVRKSDYPILSEERGMVARQGGRGSYRWIIDPLDGTLNFYRGIPMSCISIGLWKDMEPLLGVVLDFNRQEIFTGCVGRGAWLNGVGVKVSPVTEKSKAVLCTGFPISSDFSKEPLLEFVEDIRMFKKVRLFGSAALSLAYVASGRVDGYRENCIKIWDVGAGLALVKAAGGEVCVQKAGHDFVLNVKASSSSILF